MSPPRTFVSGGTGYVGRFIVEELLAAGHEVTLMGRRPPADGFFSRPVEFRPLSLEPDGISPALLEAADFFVHGAFDHVPGKYRSGEGDDPEGFRRRNLDGSRALFEAARAAGVRRIVFLSSRAVYGTYPPGTWLDEKDEPRPWTRDLSFGSKSTQVVGWQRNLVRVGHGPLQIDGWFGQATADATIAFQDAKALEADGVVGEATRSKMAEVGSGRSLDQSSVSPEIHPQIRRQSRRS
jgi:NAD(P)-dependent dehydrogenase (short-subunit alcohol dehydrogenase family)